MPAKIIGRIQRTGDARVIRTAKGVTVEISDRDVATAIVAATDEHRLWTLVKRGHVVEARVRATPMGPELRILVDRELLWSSVIRPATDQALQAAADTKHAEFTAKGWAPA